VWDEAGMRLGRGPATLRVRRRREASPSSSRMMALGRSRARTTGGESFAQR
jgi:hypothetical protein